MAVARDERLGGARGGEAAVAQGRADDRGGVRRLALGRIERPERRTGAGQPDRPAEEPAQRPLERHERRDDERGRRQQVVGRREHARPGDEVRGAQPARSSSARWTDDMPDGAVARARRIASKAAKTSGVDTAMTGVTRRTPGAPWSPGAARRLAAPLDERRAAGEEERHVRAESGGDRVAGVVVELGAPCLERAVERGRRVGRPSGEPGRDRDPLLEPGRQRRGRARPARPAATDRGPRRGDGPEDEVVGRRAGVEARRRGGVAGARRPARGSGGRPG